MIKICKDCNESKSILEFSIRSLRCKKCYYKRSKQKKLDIKNGIISKPKKLFFDKNKGLKQCNNCLLILNVKNFTITDKNNNIFRSKCKKCFAAKVKHDRLNNLDKKIALKQYHQKYVDKNKDKIKKSSDKYKNKLINDLSDRNCLKCNQIKKYTEFYIGATRCKECRREEHRQYAKNNRLKINERNKNKRKNDPEYKLRCYIPTRIREKINKNKISYIKCLGYSNKELKTHLESLFEPWMNWNNWGMYCVETWNDNDVSTWTWQIDHIIPQSDFPYTSINDENFKKCWSLGNLRPLSAKQNVIDGVCRNRHKNNIIL